jgi:hypothetical protein
VPLFLSLPSFLGFFGGLQQLLCVMCTVCIVLFVKCGLRVSFVIFSSFHVCLQLQALALPAAVLYGTNPTL